MERLVGQLLLEGLALADVAAVQHDAVNVLVVQEVGVLHLEGEWRAVPVEDRALDRVALGFARAVDRDQLSQERPVALDEQPVETPALDLMGAVSEHALDRRTLISDEALPVEHRDQVAGMGDEGAEARLALTAMEVLRERCAFDGKRDLGRECAERVGKITGDALRRRDHQRTANVPAHGEGSDHRCLPLGEPKVATHVRRRIGMKDAERPRAIAQPVTRAVTHETTGSPVG